MAEFWILILVSFFATNSLDKTESVKVKLEETQLKTFDEIFGEGWWDNDKDEEWNKLTLEHNFHYQIDRQNTQIGQIEDNSTDQNPPLTESDPSGQNSLDKAESVKLEELPLHTFDELFVEEWWDKDEAAEDLKTPPTNFGQNVHHQIDRQNTQIGQIEPNSTDQNPPLTESDHSDNAKNGEEQNEIIKEITANEKRKIIIKFNEMKDEFKQKGKYSTKEWNQIDQKIAKHLKVNRKNIYKWKKELDLRKRKTKNDRKNLIEKFDQRKVELKQAGFKHSYKNELDETVAKEMGLSFKTIYNWKSELGQTAPNKYSHSEQKELMKRYYEIKDKNPKKISDGDIAKKLKIGSRTLCSWKKLFKRQQLHPNSADGHSVEANAAANIQEIENSNLGNI